MAELLEDDGPGAEVVADTPKPSRLNSAAPDFIPGSLPCVSIERTYSHLDQVKFSPANGVCTPTSTSCWVWDSSTQGWYWSPHFVKGGRSPAGSWSPASVLAPMTPQQGAPGGFPAQHSAGSSYSDGCLASDGTSFSSETGGRGSSSIPGSVGGGPGSPLVWHQHYPPPRTPFYWHHGAASPTAMAPLTPMAFPPPHPAALHGPMHHHEPMQPPPPMQHCGMPPHDQMQPQHGHMPQGVLRPPLLQLPQGPPQQQPPFQPQTPTMHGGPPPPHGLRLGIPPPPQFLAPSLQSPSPSYGRLPHTPRQWQEPSPSWRGSQQQQGFGTPMTAPRRSRFGGGSQNASGSSTPCPSAAAADAAAAPPPALCKRAPLQEMQLNAAEPAGGAAGPCSPTRQASGISAADSEQINAVLARAQLLADGAPKEVETLTALLKDKEPLNARQRRTLRRAVERAAKVMGFGGADAGATSDSGRSADGACSSPRKGCAALPPTTEAAASDRSMIPLAALLPLAATQIPVAKAVRA